MSRRLKNIIIPFLFVLMLLSMALTSCTREANLEVIEVSDYVRYRYIEKNSKNKDAILEVFLNFEDTDYGSKGSIDNDYYIISGSKKIAPLELKVGDKLYFQVHHSLDIYPGIIFGGYLYLVD